MASRLGDWYAFSRDRFCRTTAVCDRMAWHVTANDGPITGAAMAAAAPLGGPIALIQKTVAGARGSSPMEGVCVELYSNAGRKLATCPVQTQTVGEVRSLSWTKEEDLCVLTSFQLCLFYNLSGGHATPPVSSAWHDETAPPVPCLLPVRCFSLFTGAHVPAPWPTSAPSAGLPPPAARAVQAEVVLALARADGVVTVDAQRVTRGILHGEHQDATALTPVKLPATDGRRRPRDRTSASVYVTTAIEFVCPDTLDSASLVLLWAWTAVDAEQVSVADGDAIEAVEAKTGAEGSAGFGARATSDAPAQCCVSAITWEDLSLLSSRMNLADDGDDDGFDAPTHDGDGDDRAGASSKSGKKKRLKKLKKAKGRSAEGNAAEIAALAAALSTVTSTMVLNGVVVSMVACQHDVGRLAVCTSTGILYVLASDLSSPLYTLDLRLSSPAVLQPPELLDSVWCGTRFVLLRLGSQQESPESDLSDSPERRRGLRSRLVEAATTEALLLSDRERQSASLSPQVTLLVPVEGTCAVRGERMDWRTDGGEGLLLVSEVDGARAVTDGGVYVVEDVPAALVELCRLQPPFGAAREYLAAFQSYSKGRREGFAQVRAVLARHRDASELIFFALLDAACAEGDREQQLLFLSAASFVLETTACTPHGAERMTDAVTRLRVLSALRQDTADSDEVSACCMPLTLAQYAHLGGLLQLHDQESSVDEDDAAESSWLSADRLLTASHPIKANEGRVLVDRLLSRREYQLALNLCRAYGISAAHVLSEWACTKIATMGTAEEYEDAQVAHTIRSVFSRFPDVSYLDCASVAVSHGRLNLARALVSDEPPSSRKIVLLTRLGRSVEALRSATESGDANLLHFTLCVLLDEPRSLPGSSGAGSSGRAPALDEVSRTLLSFPDALCWVACAARFRPAWQAVLEKVLLGTAPASCRWWFATFLASRSLALALEGCGPSEVKEVQHCCARGQDGLDENADDSRSRILDGQEAAGTDKHKKAKKKKSKAHDSEPLSDDRDEGDESGEISKAAAWPHDSDGDVTPNDTALMLPSLFVPKPSRTETILCFCEEDKESVRRLLTQAEVFAKETNCLPLPASVDATAEGPRATLLKKVWGLDSAEKKDVAREEQRLQLWRNALGDDPAPQSFFFLHKVDPTPFSALAPPCLAPAELLESLQRQRRLEQYQRELADTLQDTRLVSSTVSVVDTVGILAEHDAFAEITALNKAFPLSPAKLFMAQFTALCGVGKWDVVGALLGPPPSLVRSRGFFSSRDESQDAVRAERERVAAAKGLAKRSSPPPVRYEVLVEALLAYKQHELAASCVPGISTDAATRVEWYVNRIGAPIMALEAAYVGEDPGLIRQVLQRVPQQNARAHALGRNMLEELEKD